MPKRDDGLMTVAAMAGRMAQVDVYGVPYLTRQLRGFIPRGLLAPRGFRGQGRTAAALFDEHSLCQARLLSILARVPLLLRQLDTVASYHFHSLARADQERLAGLEHDTSLPAPAALDAAVEGVRRGEDWWFRLHPHPHAFDDPAIIAGTPYADAQATVPSDGTMAIMSGGFTTARCGAFDGGDRPQLVTLDFYVTGLWKPLLETAASDADDNDASEDADA